MARPRKIREITIPESIKSIEPMKTTPSGKGIYQDNPFILTNKFSVIVSNKNEVIGKDLTISDKDSDQISAGAVVRQKRVDTELFVKFYSKNVATFFELTGTAQKVLIAVILAVQDQAKNKAEIYLSYQQALMYYNSINYEKLPSKIIFSRGISQLIDAEFIANHWRKQGWYWTNPNILFYGDRLAFIDLYIHQRKEEMQQQSLQCQQSLIEQINPVNKPIGD